MRSAFAFLLGVLLLEGLLAVAASAGWWWSGVLLGVLLSVLQIVTLILVWAAFRLILRVSERLRRVEEVLSAGNNT